MNVEFTVHGKPQPQGSTRAFVPKGWKRPIITSANKNLKPWRQDVSDQARMAMGGALPDEGPIHVTCRFYFLKPKSTKKSVTYKITKPDVDKTARGVLDGLTGICFLDDSQVVSLHVTKQFCAHDERTVVAVSSCGPDGLLADSTVAEDWEL
jgi:crossover junction endodeoxyribonuclease RusA